MLIKSCVNVISGVVLGGALCGLGATSAQAAEQDLLPDSGLIERIDVSTDPFQTLDGMSQQDQAAVLGLIEELSAEEQQSLFNEVPLRAGGYTDIAWSVLEKAACVIHVDCFLATVPHVMRVRLQDPRRLSFLGRFTMAKGTPTGTAIGTP